MSTATLALSKVKVISRKYNNTLRDEYEAYFVSQDTSVIKVLVPPGTHGYDHRRGEGFVGADGVLELYFKDRWCAVWHICEKSAPANNSIYAHIAMPTQLIDNVLMWIDLDLDYRLHANGLLEKLDEDEFAHNAKTMHYPAEVIAKALATFEELGQLCQAQQFPFDYAAQVQTYRHVAHQLALLQNSASSHIGNLTQRL
jgi:protein associated with RNAse G/E